MVFDKYMLAYCGLYCKQCSFKLAHDEGGMRHLEQIPYPFELRDLSDYNCECCKGHCICGPCKIQACASTKDVDSCADCERFPCAYIDAFEQDGMPHHRAAVEGLRVLREYGTDVWFSQLKTALYCHCGERQSWYYSCPMHDANE